MQAAIKLRTPTEILGYYLERKKSKNRGYSLRALARDIDLSPAFISQVISGKRRLTPEVFVLLTDALEVDELARRQLSLSLVFNSSLPAEAKKDLNSSLQNPRAQKEYAQYEESHLPEFDLLRNWYSIAILDMVSLKGFKPQIEWIARRLKISRYQAEIAIRALFDVGLLVDEQGVWKKAKGKLRFSTKSSKESVRHYHKQMIEKAVTELTTKTDQESFERRLITGLSMAVNPNNIEKAKARLNEVMFEISEILTEGECTEVFQLNAQLFALTEKDEKK